MPTRHAAPSLDRDDATLAQIPQRYRVHDEGVGRFLRQNPHLVPVLLEIADALSAYFGPDSPRSLEMIHDPEDESDQDGDGELFAKVGTSLPPDVALARLQAFDREWWFRQLPRVAGQLTVTLEYV